MSNKEKFQEAEETETQFDNTEETTDESTVEENNDSEDIQEEPKKITKKDQIEELQAQLIDQKDKYLRLFSEFDNYRKRTAKERIELLRTASGEVIKNLLPVIDDFERALAAIPEDDKSREGVELIYNKFLGSLTKEGLKPMNSKGEDFDVDFHEALTRIPAPTEEEKGKVVDVIEKGYLLNDKVLRFAKVVVGA